MSKQQPQAAPVVAIQRLVGVHDRAGHLRTGMEQTLKGLAEPVQQSSHHPSTRASNRRTNSITPKPLFRGEG